jgi:hypothetical protein
LVGWYNPKSGRTIGGALALAKIEAPGPSERHDIVKGLSYQYRAARAYVRYYLKYTPDVLEKMTLEQLLQAFNDVVYVRSKRSRFEPEE